MMSPHSEKEEPHWTFRVLLSPFHAVDKQEKQYIRGEILQNAKESISDC